MNMRIDHSLFYSTWWRYCSSKGKTTTVCIRHFQGDVQQSEEQEEEEEEERVVTVGIPSLLEFWIIMGWFHCYIALVILTIEFLGFFSLASSSPSRDNTHTHTQSKKERNERMNCFEGYLSASLIHSLFDHHVQTSVMNVDCARKGTLFLPSAFILSYSFSDGMHTLLSIVFNIRSHRPCMCIVYVYATCLFNRCLSSLLFTVGRDLFFVDVIIVEYNNEQGMMRVKRRTREWESERLNRYTT